MPRGADRDPGSTSPARPRTRRPWTPDPGWPAPRTPSRERCRRGSTCTGLECRRGSVCLACGSAREPSATSTCTHHSRGPALPAIGSALGSSGPGVPRRPALCRGSARSPSRSAPGRANAPWRRARDEKSRTSVQRFRHGRRCRGRESSGRRAAGRTRSRRRD